MVRPADIYVLAGLLAAEGDWTYRSLAVALRVPHSVVQRALERGRKAGLYSRERRSVNVAKFEEFADHAIRFLAPVAPGPLAPGVPTAWAVEPMKSVISVSGEDPDPVWPSPVGEFRGQSIEPLHESAAAAVESWPNLGRWLSVLDCLRMEDPRIRSTAEEALGAMLRGSPTGGEG